ncbi:MAG: HAD hydrolase-like protein [Caldilineaceae bacterium]
MRYAQGFKIGVLSNFRWRRWIASLTALGLDGLVDVACAATVIGVSKPDARAYLTICTMLDVAPADSLFFDDEPDCVKGGNLWECRAFWWIAPQNEAILTACASPVSARSSRFLLGSVDICRYPRLETDADSESRLSDYSTSA